MPRTKLGSRTRSPLTVERMIQMASSMSCSCCDMAMPPATMRIGNFHPLPRNCRAIELIFPHSQPLGCCRTHRHIADVLCLQRAAENDVATGRRLNLDVAILRDADDGAGGVGNFDLSLSRVIAEMNRANQLPVGVSDEQLDFDRGILRLQFDAGLSRIRARDEFH